MKKIILGIAGAMAASLFIALFFYDSTKTAPIKQDELNKAIQQSQGKQKEQPPNARYAVDYSLQNDKLQITFDHGKSWTPVPLAIDQLFAGEYSGNKQELIENSYILTNDRAAFLYSEGAYTNQKIVLKYSLDQGKTWQDSVVAEPYPVHRFRKVQFLNQKFGYVILSGDRVVSQEISNIYLTHDGGKTWSETNPTNVTHLVKDGGFVDESTGFLSQGFINPEVPELFVTQDGGETWIQAEIKIPEKYHLIFVTAEVPFKEEDHLAILINQGPNGDYLGGKVKGKFISTDRGKTWEFSEEVKPDEE